LQQLFQLNQLLIWFLASVLSMTPTTTKKLILNAFVMQTPGHLNPGIFRYPGDQGSKYKDINHWIALAQKLEKAKFHAIFFADVLGGYDVYKGPANLEPALPGSSQIPLIDPLYTVPALAAATKSIGFGVTVSTTYEPPYPLARRFSTVDHLTNGRIAWNIVTSYLDSAARNFGLDTQIEHDERYRIADEFLHVTYKLWEGSWREDAVSADATGYTKADAVRQIHHKGKYFQVPGPHLCEPSPQWTPYLFQAGTSTAGKKFAAQHAEAVFVSGQTIDLIEISVKSLREEALSAGRDPNEFKIIMGILVIVAETDEAAYAKFEELKSYGDREGALALFGGWTGYDLSTYSDDEDFRFTKTPTVQSIVSRWASTVPGKKDLKWNKDTIADYLAVGGAGAKIIGSTKTVVDELEHWVVEGGVDGFNFANVTIPGTFDDIIEFVLPELTKRGLFHEDYEVPGGTVREAYTATAGRKTLSESHPGSKYFWRAGEEKQPFLEDASTKH
jgi:FMN-dependent oxidoreductase (nitrilotriacetate monooxygenase family)